MSLSVFQKLAGTILSTFRIGKSGPTIQQGPANPGDSQIVGNEGDMYIRVGSSPGVFQLITGVWRELGNLSLKRTFVTSASFNATMQHHYLGVNRNGSVELQLPPGVEEKSFVIKDESGRASQNNVITIVPEFGDTIDGQSSYQIDAPYGSITMVYGDGWHVI